MENWRVMLISTQIEVGVELGKRNNEGNSGHLWHPQSAADHNVAACAEIHLCFECRIRGDGEVQTGKEERKKQNCSH